MNRKILGALMIGACLLSVPVVSAHAQGTRIANPSEASAFLMDLQGAVASNDKAAASSMVSYPINVGAKAYTSSDALAADYDAVFTPSVKAAIAGTTSMSVTTGNIGNGKLTLASSGGFLKITAIDPGQ